MLMALLEVKNISKKFKKNKIELTAVNEVSFTIEKGECLGIVGESGCGKSTTAGIIARLIKEDSGNIIFDGKKINNGILLKPVGRGMQMIFQNPTDSFDPRDTLLKGIKQGAASYKIWSEAELEQRALEIIDYVGLKKEYADVKINNMSGGECQRAAIARAVISEPKLLICDEATSALDVLMQAQIVDLLKKLKYHTNMSIMFITHDIPLAAAICDRIAVMDKGRIVECDKKENILNFPKHEQTCRLIEAAKAVSIKNKTEKKYE